MSVQCVPWQTCYLTYESVVRWPDISKENMRIQKKSQGLPRESVGRFVMDSHFVSRSLMEKAWEKEEADFCYSSQYNMTSCCITNFDYWKCTWGFCLEALFLQKKHIPILTRIEPTLTHSRWDHATIYLSDAQNCSEIMFSHNAHCEVGHM